MISHSSAFRFRRFLNWFPLGLTYALLYMGRYNLTVAKTSLSQSQKLMTNEDFGVIFGVGTLTYAFSFLLNGPIVDRIGGRKGMIISATGSMIANLAMGIYLNHIMSSGLGAEAPLRLVFSVLYAANMYFQSFGAVSILKINVHWFHITERGGFSGIFGTMISSGIFLAFTVNAWLIDKATVWRGQPSQWVVFIAPGLLLGLFAVIEFFLLKDSPGHAGQKDFDTGDASSGDTSTAPVPTMDLFRRLLSSPVILTIAAIEFCTGVLRNGVMHWFPIYAKEVWVLDKKHLLVNGDWGRIDVILGMFVVAGISGFLASRTTGRRRAWLAIFAGLAFLAPFLQGGWGGILFVAGVIGGNVAGWVSDIFFQSRRGPAAGGLYMFMAGLTVVMMFVLAPPTNRVGTAHQASGLLEGDQVLAIAGKEVSGWAEIRTAVACWAPTSCEKSNWNPTECVCSTKAAPGAKLSDAPTIPARIVRGGQTLEVSLPDTMAVQRAGDQRSLKEVRPVLPLSPYLLGVLVFLISLCVIGTHGLLSGTATIDFGGKKAAATAGGLIDGAVYLGTGLQSIALGFLTAKDWGYWPPFLIPFAILGFVLCLRIWHAKPKSSGPSKPAPTLPEAAKASE